MKANLVKQSEVVWTLSGGRLSYPNLWTPGMYEGARKTGLDSSFIVSKDQPDLIKEIKLSYLKMANALNPKIKKLSQLKDCKLKMDAEGNLIIQTNNTMDYPPVYFNLKGKKENNPIAAGAPAELYAGCYTKAKLSFNPTMNEGKVKVWIGITAIQFAEDGERLGGGLTDDEVEEGFGAVKGADMSGGELEDDTGADDLGDELEDDLDAGDDLSVDDDDDLEL